MKGCLACALESVQTMIGCAQRPERQQSRSSINDADRSVLLWLSEVSDTGACNARPRCVSYLPVLSAPYLPVEAVRSFCPPARLACQLPRVVAALQATGLIR